MMKWWKKTKVKIGKICLADRFLILFLLILFCYLFFHLFMGIDAAKNTTSIDVIVRTSLAAIFGYFISGNFTKPDLPADMTDIKGQTIDRIPKSMDVGQESSIQNQIGFQVSATSSNEKLESISFSENAFTTSSSRSKMQVIIVSMIGLISLTILLLTGIFQDVTSELTAIISQLRDFVSACIGFLISCEKKRD